MFAIGYNYSDGHVSTDDHYEKPKRINYTICKLKKIYPNDKFVTADFIDYDRCSQIINLAHSKEHIQFIRKPTFFNWTCKNCKTLFHSTKSFTFNKLLDNTKICSNCNTELNKNNIFANIDADTFMTPYSEHIIYEAVTVIETIINKLSSNVIHVGFALVRPPGHHCCNKPSGFCFCNNAVIAAKYAQVVGLKKVIILDIDFHHGNGTESLIARYPDIDMISIHGFGPGIYPGTGNKSLPNVLNIPIRITPDKESRLYVNDEYYQNIITNLVKPYINNINPDFIIISLGLDGHKDDLLEGFNITDDTYIMIGEMLKEYNKPLLYILEGGYNHKIIYSVISKLIHLFH